MSIHESYKNITRRNLLAVSVVILVGLIIRLGFLALIAGHPERGISPDSESYLKPGISMASSGIYPPDNGKRPPVYPLFIALIYFLGGQNPVLIMIAQIVVDSVVIYLTYLLGTRIFPKPVALVGALIMAINIDSITYEFYYLSETLSTFFTLIALLAWGKGFQEDSRGWIVIGAILMGLSVLTRPITLYFPIILILWSFLKKERPFKENLLNASAYALTFVIVLLPWVIRNYNVLGIPTVSTITNHLLSYNAASLEAHLRGVSEKQVRNEYVTALPQKIAELGLEYNHATVARVKSMLAREIILSHPFQYIYVHLKSDLNSLLPHTNILELLGLTIGDKDTLDVLNEKGLIAAIRHYFGDKTWLIWVLLPSIILLGFIYATSLVGAVQIIRENNWFAFVLLIITCAYLLLLPGPPSIARFRVPAMPYLSLLSALGANTAYQFWRANRDTSQMSVTKVNPPALDGLLLGLPNQ